MAISDFRFSVCIRSPIDMLGGGKDAVIRDRE